MSVFVALPIFETASSVISIILVYLAARDLRRSKSSSVALSSALRSRREWREFEDTRLRELLKDHNISERDWQEILEIVDRILIENRNIKGLSEIGSTYTSRSLKAKKLILSDIISTAISDSHSKNIRELV
jgi:hypothetical protein